jgi:hypothetical protein
MSEYILILTLVSLTNSGSGIASSIESIAGFRTEEECQQAGTSWLTGVRKLSRTAESSAACVKRQQGK